MTSFTIHIVFINGRMHYYTQHPAPPPPPPPVAKRQWFEVIGVDSMCRDRDEIRRAYREKAKQYHPDNEGGQHELMAELNAAYDVAKCLTK